MADSNLPEVRLKPFEEDRLRAGHLWVFSNEIAAHPEGVAPGAVVRMTTARGAFLGTAFYNPASLITLRLLSREGQAVDAAFFRERLSRALQYRHQVLPGESSFRLCFGEYDEMPGLVIDKLGKVLVAQVHSAGMDRAWPMVQEALLGLLEPEGILLRNDAEVRKLEGLETFVKAAHGEVPHVVEVEESGLKFRVRPWEGQKTGFYFDQRANRRFLKPFFKGRRVLDLHTYVGAFALSAAKAGAAQVLGVDSSEPAVKLARENAELNALPEARFEKGDAERVLAEISGSDKSGRPDFVLVDPPPLAPSRKSLPKALRAYSKLNQAALAVLSRGGLLASSSCSHHVDREAFVGMLRDAARRAGKRTRLIELRGQAPDHPVLLAMPETEYLHFALLQVL